MIIRIIVSIFYHSFVISNYLGNSTNYFNESTTSSNYISAPGPNCTFPELTNWTEPLLIECHSFDNNSQACQHCKVIQSPAQFCLNLQLDTHAHHNINHTNEVQFYKMNGRDAIIVVGFCCVMLIGGSVTVIIICLTHPKLRKSRKEVPVNTALLSTYGWNDIEQLLHPPQQESHRDRYGNPVIEELTPEQIVHLSKLITEREAAHTKSKNQEQEDNTSDLPPPVITASAPSFEAQPSTVNMQSTQRDITRTAPKNYPSSKLAPKSYILEAPNSELPAIDGKPRVSHLNLTPPEFNELGAKLSQQEQAVYAKNMIKELIEAVSMAGAENERRTLRRKRSAKQKKTSGSISHPKLSIVSSLNQFVSSRQANDENKTNASGQFQTSGTSAVVKQQSITKQ